MLFKRALESSAKHDEIYDAEYFARQDREMAKSAVLIARSLTQKYNPRVVVDVGCGSGAILSAFKETGVDVIGFEYANAALRLCKAKGLNVRKFDLESPETVECSADVVISTEVAEHLPEKCADRYVEMLCRLGPIVVVTAATPGQGGTDHVNEQPNEYWIRKFEVEGWMWDSIETGNLRKDWSTLGVEIRRAKNVMVFRRL